MQSARRPPCLVLAFLRPDKTIALIQFLSSQDIHKIYLSVDGPRNLDEEKLQKEMIREVESICSSNNVSLLLCHRSSNHGLSASIITALDWFFEHEDSGIILEDDLSPNADFIKFCDRSLTEYKDDEDVWLISGTQYFEKENDSAISWSNYPMIWGWATWSDRWQFIKSELFDSEIKMPRNISIKVRNFWSTGRTRALSGRIDSWAVPVAYLQRTKGGLTVSPPKNLVSNLGVETTATHTRKATWYSSMETAELMGEIEFSTFDRNANAKMNNRLLESKVYRIRFRNIISPLLMTIFDKKRFSNIDPIKTLSDRTILASISNSSNKD
jgi:hypothetical protein